jgi:hypothetical protein
LKIKRQKIGNRNVSLLMVKIKLKRHIKQAAEY